MGKRTRIIVDVIHSEDGNEIYKLILVGTESTPPDECDGSGLFVDSDEVDTFIEDNNLVVTRDFRKE